MYLAKKVMKLYSPIHPKTLFNLIHVVLFQGNNISKPFEFYMFFPNEGTTETQKGFKLNNSYSCDWITALELADKICSKCFLNPQIFPPMKP